MRGRFGQSMANFSDSKVTVKQKPTAKYQQRKKCLLLLIIASLKSEMLLSDT